MPEQPKDAGGEVIMMGKRERMGGWKGELFVEIVKLTGSNKQHQYSVICDSTDSRDIGDLPETKNFDNKMEALNYAMEMERSKARWRQLKKS